MNKVKKIISIILIFMMTAIVGVNAQAALTAVLSGNSVAVNISGVSSGDIVTYTIIAPKAAMPSGPFLRNEEIAADASGKAGFTFDMPVTAVSGVYRVLASCDKISYETTFVYDNRILINAINNTSDASDIKNIIEAYGLTVDIDMNNFAVLPDSYKLKAAQLIGGKKGNGFADNASFADAYNEACAFVSVEAASASGTDALSFYEVVKKYGDILGIDITAPNNDYNKLADNGVKAAFASLMVGKEYENAQKFQEAFGNNILIAFFKTAAWPGILTYTALSASSKLSFDTGVKYQAIADKSLPFKNIINNRNSITAPADISRLFNEGADAAYNAGNGGNGPIAGGGTRGGGIPSGGASYDSGMFSPLIPNPIPDDSNDGIFTDLDQAEWAIPYIEKLYALKIIDGMGDGRFDPNADVTREQFLKMTVTAFNFELNDGTTDFLDVDASAWYASYVHTAAEAGIVNGISDNQFGTGAKISRQDMIVMIYRALAAKGKKFTASGSLDFADKESISAYASEAISVMVESGVINGVGENEFAPLKNASRAAAAKVIALAAEL